MSVEQIALLFSLTKANTVMNFSEFEELVGDCTDMCEVMSWFRVTLH